MDIKPCGGLEFIGDNSSQSGIGADARLDDLRSVIRSGYRAPVGMEDEVWLTIEGRRYRVFNLGAHGIGIYLESIDNLTLHTTYQQAEFTINDQTYHIDVTVEHLSQDETECLCGLSIKGMNEDCERALASYLDRRKSVLLS